MTNIKTFGSDVNKLKQPNIPKSLESLDYLPEEVVEIVNVVTNYPGTQVFLSSEGKLYQKKDNSPKKLKAFENIPPIKYVDSGYYHFLAISDEEEPKIYGWGKNQYGVLIGLNKSEVYLNPVLMQVDSKLNIDEIHCSGHGTTYYSSQSKTMYVSGENSNGQFGIQGQSFSQITKAQENVKKVFAGHTHHTFIIKTDDKLYGFGYNARGQLGVAKAESHGSPIEIELEFPVEDISKIECGYDHSGMLTVDGKVYVAGNPEHLGLETDSKTGFQEYQQFKKNKTLFKDISISFTYISLLSTDNEIWVGGHFFTEKKLRKILTIKENLSFNTLICSDQNIQFTLYLTGSFLQKDLGVLLKNGSFSDCKIQKIPVHKLLIETRIEKPFEQIKNYLEENCTSKEIENVLKWIYTENLMGATRTKEILSYFGIEKPQTSKSLTKDLKKLLFNRDSTDFMLLVKDDYDDNDDDDEDDDEDNEFEEIPVHKFLIAARSGLFREMFKNVDQILEKVQDYSGKSLETIELLISFLYTDEIPITADHDLDFIKEEFEDIVEYYQLNSDIPIMNILEKCAKN
ncbi:secretion-regulating guanine nucleotide exchange factor [Anaeramoeba flamelloides]|uniref:Secretion-regulating guanine nucleotide exchange factor n=1 Tax=Anaeramoeba flamelloides TaxID=1746091 RepID=A0ABQ8YRU2_9EUKA|nr:secretion-regulating guanine nucleotide exchange factor [Anaeramoeba flamelloides]